MIAYRFNIYDNILPEGIKKDRDIPYFPPIAPEVSDWSWRDYTSSTSKKRKNDDRVPKIPPFWEPDLDDRL